MPTVPRRDPQSIQGLKPLPDVQVTGGATAETFGGGASLEKVGTALEGLNTQNIKLAIAHQEAMDDAFVNNLDASLSKDRNAIFGTLSRDFKGAKAAEIPDYTAAQIKELKKKYDPMIPNDNIRAKFDKKLGVYAGQIDYHGQNVMTAEGQRFQEESYKAKTETSKENISKFWMQPSIARQEKFALDETRKQFYAQQGLLTLDEKGNITSTTPQYDLQKQKDESDIVKGTIEKMLAEGQTVQAEKYYKYNKSKIMGKDSDSYGDYIKQAENTRITEAAKNQKLVFEQNDHDLMGMMFRGELTMAEVTRRYEAGLLDKADWNSYATKLSSDDYKWLRISMGQKNAAGTLDSTRTTDKGVPLQTDPDVFATIRQHQLSGDMSKREIDKMISRLSGNVEKGIMADDAEFLRKQNEKVTSTPSDRAIDSNTNAIQSWGNDYIKTGWGFGEKEKQNQIAILKKQFLDQVDKEGTQDPTRIKQINVEVRNAYIKKRHPEVNNIDDIPHLEVLIGGAVNRFLGASEPTTLKPTYTLTRNQMKPKAEKKPEK